MDPFSCSDNSPSSTLRRDCWLTLDGVVPIEKQFGLDLGHVRASTLGTNGSVLHFEFKRVGPETSCLIVDAIEQSRAERINLEFHVPTYSLRASLNPQEAISFLKQVPAETAHLDLVFENHLSLFLIRPVSFTGQSWLDENVDNEDTLTFGNAVVCEPRYVESILRGAIAAGLEVA